MTLSLKKGSWYVLLRYPPESTYQKPIEETLLISITSSPDASGYSLAHVIDTGEDVSLRPEYVGGPKRPGDEWGAEIRLDDGRNKHFSHCRQATQDQAEHYCNKHHLSLPSHEQDGFRSRIARFFGG